MAKCQRNWRAILLACSALALSAPSALAQEAGSNGAISNENIRVLKPSFFAAYNPVTALDMVNQVPGFSIEDISGERGFGGTAGNVLIDGERPSTKSTSLHEILQRIPADRVIRIELISGPVPGLDMRGKTQVVNVVLKTGGKKPQYAWNVSLTQYRDRLVPTGELSISLRAFKTDINVGMQRNGHGRRLLEQEILHTPTGTLIEQADATDQRSFGEWQPYFAMHRKFGDTYTLNLNGKYWDWHWGQNVISTVRAPSPVDLLFSRYDFNRSDNNGGGGEIGGDFEWAPSDTHSVKLIALQHSDAETDLYSAESWNTAGFDYLDKVNAHYRNNESILRLQGNWTPSPKNSFEASIEGAYNWRETALSEQYDDGSGLRDVNVPLSNTRVQERRAEGALSWITHPRKNLTIESGLRVETSEIRQSGDALNARAFTYFKPSLLLTWDLSPRNEIQLTGRRDVGQLDFGNFATSVDLRNNQTNLGNVDLRPDQTWIAKARFERKYGKKGTFILSATQRWIEDVRDVVPIDHAFDAPGNIGNGQGWQVEAEARIPTDRFHLPGGLLTLEGGFGNSQVTDPVTGEKRVISFVVDDYYRVEFRQDIPGKKFAWGFDYFKRTPWQAWYLYEHQIDAYTHGDLDAFVETSRFHNITVRVGVDSIFSPAEIYSREFYNLPRDVGMITSISDRTQVPGPKFYISAKSVF